MAPSMRFRLSRLELQIVRILKDWYPITVEELVDEVSARRDSVMRALKSLMVKGLIAFEPLTDKTYIRLLSPDMEVDEGGQGKKEPPKAKGPDDDDYSYA